MVQAANSNFATTYTYDADGNITHLSRKDVNANLIDDLAYNYYDLIGKPNQLENVEDVISTPLSSKDIENQGAANYTYDEIGNLISDVSEQIASIEWTVYGKIKKITRTAGSTKPNLEFGYDATGNRLWKKVIISVGNETTTWYIRDAQGNVMSSYTQTSTQFHWQSATIYGSSRIGEYQAGLLLADGGQPVIEGGSTNELKYYRGNKRYEIANHLGNVLATITDRKFGKSISGQIVFVPDINTTEDTYPFGMKMEERSFTVSGGGYRYGFNGQEKENDLSGIDGGHLIFEYRIHDVRIGRFLSVDPLEKEYPWNSTYAFAENDVIRCIDLEGAEKLEVIDLVHPTNDEIGKAKIVISLDYMIVTSGNASIKNYKNISEKDFHDRFSQGNTFFYLTQLPTPNSEIQFLSEKHLKWADKAENALFKFRREYYKRKLKAENVTYYKVNIEYNFNLIIKENTTVLDAERWRAEKPHERGIEMGLTEDIKYFRNELAKYYDFQLRAIESYNDKSKISGGIGFNEELFYQHLNATIIFEDKMDTKISLVHEAGHNLAKGFYHGNNYEYNQEGLSSNTDPYPTKGNTIDIINDKSNRETLIPKQ